MNILILAAGTRNKIVQYFRKALKGLGNVIAADASELAPAIYEADKYYIVPPITAEGYIDEILDICNAEKFRSVGTTVIGSSYALCEMSLDKMQMYAWLKEHGYRCARSWKDKEAFFNALDAGEAAFPVFVKPYRGSASISISKVYDRETIDLLYAH